MVFPKGASLMRKCTSQASISPYRRSKIDPHTLSRLVKKPSAEHMSKARLLWMDTEAVLEKLHEPDTQEALRRQGLKATDILPPGDVRLPYSPVSAVPSSETEGQRSVGMKEWRNDRGNAHRLLPEERRLELFARVLAERDAYNETLRKVGDFKGRRAYEREIRAARKRERPFDPGLTGMRNAGKGPEEMERGGPGDMKMSASLEGMETEGGGGHEGDELPPPESDRGGRQAQRMERRMHALHERLDTQTRRVEARENWRQHVTDKEIERLQQLRDAWEEGQRREASLRQRLNDKAEAKKQEQYIDKLEKEAKYDANLQACAENMQKHIQGAHRQSMVKDGRAAFALQNREECRRIQRMELESLHLLRLQRAEIVRLQRAKSEEGLRLSMQEKAVQRTLNLEALEAEREAYFAQRRADRNEKALRAARYLRAQSEAENQRRTEQTLDAAFWDIADDLKEAVKSKRQEWAKRQAEVRKSLQSARANTAQSPGPGAYRPSTTGISAYTTFPSWGMHRTVNRLGDAFRVHKQTPAPWNYSSEKISTFYRDKRGPRMVPGGDRSSIVKGKPDDPGPGHYEPVVRGANAVTLHPKIPIKHETATPGPGSYDPPGTFKRPVSTDPVRVSRAFRRFVDESPAYVRSSEIQIQRLADTEGVGVRPGVRAYARGENYIRHSPPSNAVALREDVYLLSHRMGAESQPASPPSTRSVSPSQALLRTLSAPCPHAIERDQDWDPARPLQRTGQAQGRTQGKSQTTNTQSHQRSAKGRRKKTKRVDPENLAVKTSTAALRKEKEREAENQDAKARRNSQDKGDDDETQMKETKTSVVEKGPVDDQEGTEGVGKKDRHREDRDEDEEDEKEEKQTSHDEDFDPTLDPSAEAERERDAVSRPTTRLVSAREPGGGPSSAAPGDSSSLQSPSRMGDRGDGARTEGGRGGRDTSGKHPGIGDLPLPPVEEGMEGNRRQVAGVGSEFDYDFQSGSESGDEKEGGENGKEDDEGDGQEQEKEDGDEDREEDRGGHEEKDGEDDGDANGDVEANGEERAEAEPATREEDERKDEENQADEKSADSGGQEPQEAAADKEEKRPEEKEADGGFGWMGE
uniref:Uncharacterized protein n=1 Tax=Chromera velia CCMP2878 TaxID=1169474 RepID=A0A0G4HRI5_9ALVE|eukprot:Cvel_1287.t1-p1 / transcript=Cvel_1287.t1 / gene=Cvel_1287 / organism=Chromera_velia_CCMP2878 / gene_product=Inner centromere protein, putative / transcript_product=Inner centromere protein, putative / location=Cvel_scaffold43:86025-94105(+) / protein_length=1095 / sequence_SO=supercontig / SO=protein_coding / is_pseudo=false